jgi:hypothetical protein
VDIYRAWLDSIAHSGMTGGEAIMSDEVGADVSAWDGYITGRNLELVPGERIVQSWRTAEFDEEHADSVVTILLRETEDGTLLTLEHSNVPDEHKSYEESGWQSNYFEPMVVYFADVKEDLSHDGPAEGPLPEAAPEPAPPSKTAGGPRPRRASGAKRRAGGAPQPRGGRGRQRQSKSQRPSRRRRRARRKPRAPPARRRQESLRVKPRQGEARRRRPRAQARDAGANRRAANAG